MQVVVGLTWWSSFRTEPDRHTGVATCLRQTCTQQEQQLPCYMTAAVWLSLLTPSTVSGTTGLHASSKLIYTMNKVPCLMSQYLAGAVSLFAGKQMLPIQEAGKSHTHTCLAIKPLSACMTCPLLHGQHGNGERIERACASAPLMAGKSRWAAAADTHLLHLLCPIVSDTGLADSIRRSSCVCCHAWDCLFQPCH